VIARKLTKIYETFHRGNLGEELSPPFIEKAECVVIVESGKEQRELSETTEEDLLDFIQTKLAQNESPKDVAKALAERFKIKKKAAYTMVLDLRK
jgi:16S rRNA C1402 (ribose-2'-O) methylase RsmI